MNVFKVLGNRPTPVNIPGSLKNNSAITITSKSGPRPGLHRIMRPSMNKITRPVMPGQKIADMRNRMGDLRSYSSMRPKLPMSPRTLRPNLPGSLSITKIPKDIRKPGDISSRIPTSINEEPQVLDSDDEDDSDKTSVQSSRNQSPNPNEVTADVPAKTTEEPNKPVEKENVKVDSVRPLVLTTDEKLPPEEVLETKPPQNEPSTTPIFHDHDRLPEPMNLETKLQDDAPINLVNRTSSKINLLKNYRHQRPGTRPQNESSLSQLERTTSSFNKEGIPDFRKNLDDITQSYSPGSEEKSSSRKKKSPNKIDILESQNDRQTNMTHSVSSLLGPNKARLSDNIPNSTQSRIPPALPQSNMAGLPQEVYNMGNKVPMPSMGHTMLANTPPLSSDGPLSGPQTSNIIPNPLPTSSQPYPNNPPAEVPYGQYPGNLFVYANLNQHYIFF